MSFRGRGDSGGNPNKMDLGEPRKFGGPDNDKSSREDSDRFDSGRGRSSRPPFGRGRQSPGRDKPYNDRPRDYGYGRDEPMMRDRSPIRGSDDRFSDRFRKDDSFSKRDDHGRKDSGRPFYGDEPPRDRYMDRPRHESGPGNYNSRFDGPPSKMPYSSRPLNYPTTGSKGPYYGEGFPRPNECEIIVVNKLQRAYAESVENRVKGIGILVDILFLKDEALLTQTIDDVARRGSLYAMVISPQNETHGSVTVNILHGTPQEHRNMPLEDALKLLARNFHDHIRSQREYMERERTERGQYVGVVADREMQFLLRMLADGRWISLSEINLVIRYLTDRRDKMQTSPGDDRVFGRMPFTPADVKMEPPFKPKDDTDVSQKEQDLQNRIINLMNQGAPSASVGAGQGLGLNQGMPDMDMPPPRSNQPAASPNLGSMRPPVGVGSGMKSGRPGLDENLPGPQGLSTGTTNKDSPNKPIFSSGSALPTDPASTATYINFDNPSVQKALDNLMQSGPNLLKNISLSTSGVTNTSASQSSIPAAENSGMTPPNDPLHQRGNMGPRGSDIGGNLPLRNTGNMDMGPRRPMGDIGGPGGPRNSGIPGIGGMGGMGPERGGYGGNMPGMGGMGTDRGGYGGNMPDMGRMGPPRGGMGPPQGQDHGPPQNMGPGSYGNQNQFNKFQGPGQQGNFPGPYNSGSGMGSMPRQNYGGPQGMGGMGGGPRRY